MKRILRHRVGLHSRETDLSVLTADPTVADPLLGNYQLVRQENILTAFQGQANNEEKCSLQLNIHKIHQQDGKYKVDSEVAFEDIKDYQLQKICATRIDYNNKGVDAIILAFADKGVLKLKLIADIAEGSQVLIQDTEIGEITENSRIKIITAFLSEQPTPYFLVVYESKEAELILQAGLIIQEDQKLFFSLVCQSVYQNYQPALPLASPVKGLTTPDAQAFDIAAGMLLTGKSSEQIILVCQTKENDFKTGEIVLNAFLFENKGFSVIATTALGEARLDANVAVAAGYLNAALYQDSIVVACSDVTGDLRINVIDVLKNENNNKPEDSYSCKTGKTLTYPWGNAFGVLALDIGDVNQDGIEEVIVGTQSVTNGQFSSLQIRVLVVDNKLSIAPATEKASVAYLYDSKYSYLAEYGLELNVGSLQGGLINTIAINCTGQKFGVGSQKHHYQQTNAVIMVNPQLEFPKNMRDENNPAKLELVLVENDIYCPDARLLSTVTLLADTSGATIRVGPPIAKVATASSVIAVINFPPVHNGINGPKDDSTANIALVKSGQYSQTIGLDTQSTYTHSDNLSMNMGLNSILSINQSIDNSYGENFSHVTQSIDSMTITVNSSSTSSDAILTSETICNTWQYPVYGKNKEGGSGIQGYLLVIFPTLPPKTGVMWGDDPRALYSPGHVVGNIASYPNYSSSASNSVPQNNPGPSDYNPQGGSFSNMFISVGSGETTVDFTWDTVSSNTVQSSSEQSLNITTGFSLSKSFEFLDVFSLDLGVDKSITDTYTETTSSLHDITYTQSTQITLGYEAIPNAGAKGQDYQVIPYVYWSDKGGYLKVDYTLLYPTASWYTSHFQTSLPCFNMPFMFMAEDKKNALNRLLTRDITFYPPRADNNFEPGRSEITVTATVHNHSLSKMDNITVQFFSGDATSYVPISEIIRLGDLQAHASRNVETIWIPDKLEPTKGLKLWCVINPEITLAGLEIPDDFNSVIAIDKTNTTCLIAYNRWPLTVFTS